MMKALLAVVAIGLVGAFTALVVAPRPPEIPQPDGVSSGGDMISLFGHRREFWFSAAGSVEASNLTGYYDSWATRQGWSSTKSKMDDGEWFSFMYKEECIHQFLREWENVDGEWRLFLSVEQYSADCSLPPGSETEVAGVVTRTRFGPWSLDSSNGQQRRR